MPLKSNLFKILLVTFILFNPYALAIGGGGYPVEWERDFLNCMDEMASGKSIMNMDEVKMHQKIDDLEVVIYRGAKMLDCNSSMPAILLMWALDVKAFDMKDFLIHENRATQTLVMAIYFYFDVTERDGKKIIDYARDKDKENLIEQDNFIKLNKKQIANKIIKIIRLIGLKMDSNRFDRLKTVANGN